MTTNAHPVPLHLPKAFLRGRRANRVLPGDAFDAAGRKVLRRLYMEMARHQPGIVGSHDKRAVHDMRVAVRRIRAAFDLFEQYFPRKAVKTYGRFLKELGGLLGAVRDTDVMIENGQAYAESLPEAQRAAFEPLIDFIKTQRAAARQPLSDFLTGGKYLDFTGEFPIFLSDPGSKGSRAGHLSRVSELAPLLILERLGEVRSFDGHIESLSIEELHGLRGSIKRLRYALEFFQEPLGPQAAVLISNLKNVQNHLGQLNDASLAAGAIQGFIDQWNARQTGLPASEQSSSVPFLPYLTETLSKMDVLVQGFPAAWEQFNTADFRKRLARAIGRL